MTQSSTQTVVVRGWPLPTVLTLVFVILKLTGAIAWSWWWVLSPLWISAGLAIIFFLLFLVVGYILLGKR